MVKVNNLNMIDVQNTPWSLEMYSYNFHASVDE